MNRWKSLLDLNAVPLNVNINVMFTCKGTDGVLSRRFTSYFFPFETKYLLEIRLRFKADILIFCILLHSMSCI